MQEDHIHPGYNLKEKIPPRSLMHPNGSQREDDPYERGQLHLRVWRRRGFHEQVHRNERRKAKQLGVREETDTGPQKRATRKKRKTVFKF